MVFARVFLAVGIILHTHSSLAVLPEKTAFILSSALAGGATVHACHAWKSRNESGAYWKLESGEKMPLAIVGAAMVALPAAGYAGTKAYKVLPHVQLRVARGLLVKARKQVEQPFYSNKVGRRIDSQDLEEHHVKSLTPYRAAFKDLQKGDAELSKADIIVQEVLKSSMFPVQLFFLTPYQKRCLASLHAFEQDANALRTTIKDRMMAIKKCPGYREEGKSNPFEGSQQ